MALFVKCCAVHTPSTNPNKAPAAHLSDTLRHPGTLLRRGRHARLAATPQMTGIPPPSTSNPPQARQNRQQRRPQQPVQSNPAPASNRTPSNITAPPLISPPANATAPPIEPPPPYTPNDPASSGPSVPPSLIGNPAALSPVQLPGAPAPAPPPLATLPVIPGGPKPGRRRPKKENSKDAPSTSKNKRSAK